MRTPLTDPAIALAEAVHSAAYIGARLVMDIEPMTRLFQIIPQEDIVRFDTCQISPEQWEITMHPTEENVKVMARPDGGPNT